MDDEEEDTRDYYTITVNKLDVSAMKECYVVMDRFKLNKAAGPHDISNAMIN